MKPQLTVHLGCTNIQKPFFFKSLIFTRENQDLPRSGTHSTSPSFPPPESLLMPFVVKCQVTSFWRPKRTLLPPLREELHEEALCWGTEHDPVGLLHGGHCLCSQISQCRSWSHKTSRVTSPRQLWRQLLCLVSPLPTPALRFLG